MNTLRISFSPLPSASSKPSKTRACWGLNIPLAICVFSLSPVMSAVGTSPLTVRWLKTTGMSSLDTTSLMALPNSVEIPPAPSPATCNTSVLSTQIGRRWSKTHTTMPFAPFLTALRSKSLCISSYAYRISTRGMEPTSATCAVCFAFACTAG